MASREWAIKKSTGKRVYIGDEEKQWIKLSPSAQKKFDVKDYKCEFCGLDYTASALGPDKKQSYFRVGTNDWSETCSKKNNACEVTIPIDNQVQLTEDDRPNSDLGFIPRLPIIDELDFNGSLGNSRGSQNNSNGDRAPQMPTGKSSILASAVRCFLDNEDTIKDEPLKIKGASGETYGEIFQELSRLTGNQRPKGEHIFYGTINYLNPPVQNDQFIEIKLFMFYPKKRHNKKTFSVKVYLDNWKKPQADAFIKSIQEALFFREKHATKANPIYIYFFWYRYSDEKFSNSMIVNDHRKVYIVATRERIDFEGSNLGIYEPDLINKAETFEKEEPKPNIELASQIQEEPKKETKAPIVEPSSQQTSPSIKSKKTKQPKSKIGQWLDYLFSKHG